MTSRDELRAKIFDSRNRHFKSELVEFFGDTIEIRQPTLEQILNAQALEDRREAIINLIIGYCYVPGTDERVFEDTDRPALLKMPFGEDFTRVNEAIARMTSLNVEAAEKNSEGTLNAELP